MANRDKDILRKNRIVGHRRKKGLCLNCGKNLDHESSSCKEDFRIVDTRDVIPLVVQKNKDIEQVEKLSFTEQKQEDIVVEKIIPEKVFLQRDYIILDLSHSRCGNIIEFSGLQRIAQKYKDCIICIFGNLENSFSVADMLHIRKFPNIFEIKFINKKIKTNYLHSCKYYLSFPSETSIYCKENNIPHFEFPEEENVTKVINQLPNI